MKNAMKASAFLLMAVALSGSKASAYTCDLTEIDLNQTPHFTSKPVPNSGTVLGDKYPDVRVTIRQTKNGSMHIKIESNSRNYIYADGFGQINAGATALLDRADDSKQVSVLCNDFDRISVPK